MPQKKLTVYAYAKCTTCQRALRFLDKHHITYTLIPIESNPPSMRELEQMLGYVDGKLRKLFNTSGMLYRSMKLAEKMDALKKAEALALLSRHGMLVKRPFVLSSDTGAVGFKEDVWEKNFVEPGA